MLQMLSLDVADMCCWVLHTLIFNVADIEFRCCRHVVLGVVLRRGEGKLLMLQHGWNIVATWSQHVGRREERLLMLDVASNRVRNIFVTHSQHARNIYLVVFRSNG
jgi:hypothetical protein